MQMHTAFCPLIVLLDNDKGDVLKTFFSSLPYCVNRKKSDKKISVNNFVRLGPHLHIK